MKAAQTHPSSMIKPYELSLPPAQTSFQVQHFSSVKTAEHTFFASFNTPSLNTGNVPGSVVGLGDTDINKADLCL